MRAKTTGKVRADSSFMRMVTRMSLIHHARGLKSSRSTVLSYLHLRLNDKLGYTWVSNENIAHTCKMAPSTVTCCLGDLQRLGFITRDLRDSDVNKSRKTVIHWDKIEACQIPKFRDEDAAPSQDTLLEVDPEEQALANSLGTLSFSTRENSTGLASTGTGGSSGIILDLLQEYFGEHSSYQHPGAEGFMLKCALACVEHAGSEDRCLEILRYVCTDPDHERTRKRILDCEKLGGFITKAFPGWMDKFDERIEQFEQILLGLRKGKKASVPRELTYLLDHFETWLVAKLGEDSIERTRLSSEETEQLEISFLV
jgi:hypothetical protein